MNQLFIIPFAVACFAFAPIAQGRQRSASGSLSKKECSSVPKAWSILMKAYQARDSKMYAKALKCLRSDIKFGGTAEISSGVSIGHFCSSGNNAITGTFPTGGTPIACVALPRGVVAYSDNFATCRGSCAAR